MPNTYSEISTKKFLDADGLTYFARKLNDYPNNDVLEAVIDGIQDALDDKLDADKAGATNGVATLDETGNVPASQLGNAVGATYTLSQDLSDGHIIILTDSNGGTSSVTVPDNNTTYSEATDQATGLMSAADKAKLDTVDPNANELDVTYDSVSKRITKTTGRVTSLIVSADTLKEDMNFSKEDIGLDNVENKSAATILSELSSSNVTTALGFTPMNAALKGAVSGVAELDEYGKVVTSQLPSYVDDVIEYADRDHLPVTGEAGKIYVTIDTNKTYRWSGSDYVEISASLALGTTANTAYRGDYGDAAYTHAVTNKGSAFTNGLYKITTNAEGHVTGAIAVVKDDITNLGIPAQDTTYDAITDAQIDALFV